MRKLIAVTVLATCLAPVHADDRRVSDPLRTVEEEWSKLEADRIGMTIVCDAGVPRGRALGLFDKMARAEAGTSYLQSHDDPFERRVIVAEWARAQNLVCLD